MKKVNKKLISKLNVFSRKRQFQHMPMDEEEDIEDFRIRGCEILRAISDETHKEMISAFDDNMNDGDYHNTSSNTGIEMDWHETIQRFQEYHQHVTIQNITQGGNDDDGRQSKVERLKSLKRALERRRKFDNKGSFAINMVTYRDETTSSCGFELDTVVSEGGGSNRNDYHKRGDHLGCDDRSCRSSVTATMSNDLTLRAIEEEKEYFDSDNNKDGYSI